MGVITLLSQELLFKKIIAYRTECSDVASKSYVDAICSAEEIQRNIVNLRSLYLFLCELSSFFTFDDLISKPIENILPKPIIEVLNEKMSQIELRHDCDKRFSIVTHYAAVGKINMKMIALAKKLGSDIDIPSDDYDLIDYIFKYSDSEVVIARCEKFVRFQPKRPWLAHCIAEYRVPRYKHLQKALKVLDNYLNCNNLTKLLDQIKILLGNNDYYQAYKKCCQALHKYPENNELLQLKRKTDMNMHQLSLSGLGQHQGNLRKKKHSTWSKKRRPKKSRLRSIPRPIEPPCSGSRIGAGKSIDFEAMQHATEKYVANVLMPKWTTTSTTGFEFDNTPMRQFLANSKRISLESLKIVHRLHKRGYKAYFVGGVVRDILRNKQPDDFDLVTTAPLDKVKAILKLQDDPVGKKHQLYMITIRGEGTKIDISSTEGARIIDYMAGVDYTINSMFWDPCNSPLTESVLTKRGSRQENDHNQLAIQHLKKRLITTIGDADQSMEKDPIRIIRGIYRVAKDDFKPDPATLSAWRKNMRYLYTRQDLKKPPSPYAVCRGICKIICSENAAKCFQRLSANGYPLAAELLPFSKRLKNFQYGTKQLIWLQKLLEHKDTFKLTIKGSKFTLAALFFAAALYDYVLGKIKIYGNMDMEVGMRSMSVASTIWQVKNYLTTVPEQHDVRLNKFWGHHRCTLFDNVCEILIALIFTPNDPVARNLLRIRSFA